MTKLGLNILWNTF